MYNIWPIINFITLIFLSQTITTTMAGKVLNKKWILKNHPEGKFNASRDVELVEETIDLGNVPEEKVVVEVQSLSIDAFIRTMVRTKKEGRHSIT